MTRLRDFIKKYLIPHNRHIEVIDIKDASSTSGTEEPHDTFSWVGGGAFCERVVWVPDGAYCETNSKKRMGEEGTAICEQEVVIWEGIDPYCITQ